MEFNFDKCFLLPSHSCSAALWSWGACLKSWCLRPEAPTVALTFVNNLTKEPKRRRSCPEHLLGAVTEKVGPFRKSLATFDTVGHYVAKEKARHLRPGSPSASRGSFFLSAKLPSSTTCEPFLTPFNTFSLNLEDLASLLVYSKLAQWMTWQRPDANHTLNSIIILLPTAFIEGSAPSDVETAVILGMVPCWCHRGVGFKPFVWLRVFCSIG